MLGPLVGSATYRRWAFLIVGGALLVPYLLIGMFAVPAVLPSGVSPGVQGALLLGAFTGVAVVVVLTSFLPAVRILEGTAVRELLCGPGAGAVSAERTWAARWRATAWFVLHLGAGGVVSTVTLVLPPVVVVALAKPFVPEVDLLGLRLRGTGPAWAWLPVAGVVALVLLVYAVAGVGAVLARLAPVFLGPSAAERLAEVEARAAKLAERNRLARELHDSVGHALSVVSIQAGAAGRVLDSDPEFARRALAAIEDSARAALTDLDHVLGLLREDRPTTAPQPTLVDLPGLLDRTRLAGLPVESEVSGDLAGLPAVVSREAYRIVQEALTNVLRHAGRVPAELRLAVGADELEISVANPLGTSGRGGGGGRGLRGMRERATVLRGRLRAGASDGRWTLAVVLPLRAGHGKESP